MLKNLYFNFKEYILGGEFKEKTDLFEKVKTELIFNILIIFTFIYLIGFIKIFIFSLGYILIGRVIGVLLIFSAFYALKKFKHYRVPVTIWAGGFIVMGLQGLIIMEGQMTFGNLGFSLLNVTMVFLMLSKRIKIAVYFYYVLFISYALASSYSLIKPIQVGIDFTYDQSFYANNIIFSLTPFFILIYILYAFVTYEYRVKIDLTNQIDDVMTQENDINLANQEMTKSFEFASQIQKAFLPNLDNLNHFIQDRFILLKPKNELSGDFYWSAEVGHNLYVAVIDSSENNISGAILSSIYYNALDTAVKKENLESTADIICFLNRYLQTKANVEFMKDGIQISMVKVDNKSHKLYFASERNSLFIARKNQSIIDEFKAKIVKEEEHCIKYREVVMDYNDGDMIYLGSDGLANQFPGFDNEKFKESVLKSYLNTIKNETLQVQKDLLSNKLNLWNNGDLQSDDVCMIGLKL